MSKHIPSRKYSRIAQTMAYLGTRGYTIPKEQLSLADQDRIRRELSVAPAATGMSFARPSPYPVFREATSRFYLPRFYGQKTFGPFTKPSKLKVAEKLETTFKGKLRDDQQVVANQALDALRNVGGGLLELHCGYGKTVVALYIAAAIGLKTAVLVHKEFLMTQWAERIEMFLPGVRIGKIQAQTCDMEDKDIVMVMIQSLATKDYPMDLFSGIGLVIVDECHHMSAEVFSNALFKAVTPHMLGLSATMTRKDGLSRVFKMFLGDVVAKRARQGEIKTCVEILRYTNDDEEFNETVLGFNGQISFSSMLSKLSSCEHRLDFIAKRVERLVNEENRAQVMVLTHYRAMISALSDRFLKYKIEHGYYVGGMKQADLDNSAKKRVVLGTFAMAEEGLDIKTLDTLVLATSKSDVVQAVGRVQRSPDVTPLIVDIVDPHPCFKRQHAKRLTFYRKSKFEIDGTTTEPKPRRKAIAAKKEQAKSKKGQSSGKCMISSAEEDWA